MHESIDEPTARLLLEALGDGRLDYLFQAAHVDYTERDGFASQSATLGLPRDAVSHLLETVRRAQGLTILAGAWGEYAGWITLSAELIELLHWIDIRAGFDLSSATDLPDDEIRLVHNQILIEEVLPLGLTMGELSPTNEIELSQATNAARRMLQEGSEPTTDYERWVLRFFDLMQRLPEIAAEPLTVERMCDLHAQLAIDPATGGVFRTTERTENPGVGFAADGRGALPERIQGEMNAMASYATDNVKPFVHPLIKAIVYFYWIRRVQPFSVANGLFARLIAHVYEYQQGYRGLPWTPLTRTQSSEWAVPPPNVYEPRFDATAFVITRLHLFLNAYIEAERELDTASRRYRALCARYHGHGLNHRQARILDQAFETPTTVFTIRRHARARVSPTRPPGRTSCSW